MSSVVTIKPITRRNALVLKAVRLRALQDAPTAFGSTYAPTPTHRRRLAAARRRVVTASARRRSWRWTPAHPRAGVGRELVGTVPDWARGHAVGDVRRTPDGTEPYPNDPDLFEREMVRAV